MRLRSLLLPISLLGAVIPSLNAQRNVQTDHYSQSILKWREQRQAKLRADDGYLTVSGLFWLKEGDNTFGSSPVNDIVLPKNSPAKAGGFVLKQNHVFARLDPSA